MGKIMKDGISYSGSTYTGGTDIEITGANVINAKVRELTQAQYDALSSAEKNNGTTYYITDGIPSVIGVTDVEANGTSIVSNHVANIPLVSSANNGLVPQGASVTTQSQTTKFLREDGSWAAPSYTSVSDKANIDGSNIANPSAFRQNIGLAKITPTITATNVIYSAAQIGNMVIGSAEMAISSAQITVWTNVASININPTVNITVPAVRTGNGSHVGMIQIKTDGTIRLFSTQALNNNNIAFTFSYRTN